MTKNNARFANKNAVANPENVDEKLPSQSVASECSLDKQQSEANLREDLLITSQLFRSTPPTTLPIENASAVLRENALSLYRALAPRNAQESILARYIVVVSNAGLECLAKLNETNDLFAQEMLFKYGLKCAERVDALVESYAQLRGEIGPDVNVGSVNVEAGGQAIVGKVALGDRSQSHEEVVVTPQLKRCR